MQHSLACPSKQNERKFFAPRDHNISNMFQYLRFLHTRDRIGDVIVWRYPERHIELSPVLVQVDFEVFGFLHGVNFLTHAKSLADRLGVRGWIRISRYGSAIGQIQGEKDRVDEMALWLRHTGSPGCRIEFVDYQNWHVLDGYDYKKFNARV